MLSRRAALCALVVAGALASCASQPMPPPGQAGISQPIEQPLKDLSLIREVAPEVLTKAVAAPYRPATDCPALQAEIALLDQALGPDIDQPKAGSKLESLIASLVGGAVGLPFRGVVRTVTGADTRERALKAAILGGMVRRGYLKGAEHERGCPPAPAPATPADRNATGSVWPKPSP